MSILSVDNISPIGSGTSVTVNNAATLVVNNVNVAGVTTFAGAVSGSTATFSGNLSANGLTATSFVSVGDNDTINVGSGNDLKIYHQSSDNNSYIENDTGNLIIRADAADKDITLQAADALIFNTGGANERFRIKSNGQIVLGSDGTNSELTFTQDGTSGTQLNATTTGSGGYNTLSINSATFIHKYGTNERLRITGIGSFGFGNSSPHRKVDIVGNSLLIRPTTASDAASGNANAVNNSLILRMPYGQNAGSTNNAGARIGIQFTGATDNALSWGYVDNPQKSASVYGVSEDTSAGYSRKMGLAFYTSPHDSAQVERVRISADGYVTKPYTPMFIAGRTGGNYTATVGTFPFNVARINVGNHYSTSTYKFTAPVAGVYYFFAQVYYNNGSGHYRVGFRKEPSGGSAFMLNTAAHHMVGNDNSQTLSIIESMAVGDTVRLFSDQNASIQCYYDINGTTYGAHTYFMGYLIG